MATQVKELVKRSDIRTMKKDLKRLREVDATKERDKIVTAPIIAPPAPTPKPTPPPAFVPPVRNSGEAKPKPIIPQAPAASAQSFGEPKEKPYLKNASVITKESIEKSSQAENPQRKKFMEDVEKWAASS